MKLLVTFLLLCLVVLGVFVVQYATRGTRAAADAAHPATAAHVVPAHDASAQRTSAPPVDSDSAPAADVESAAHEPAQPSVRWPGDARESAADARLARARTALANDAYNETALRDELRALRALERWEAALGPVGRLIELHPDDAEPRLTRATVLMRLARWASAADALRELVAQHPDNALSWYNLAIVHQQQGNLHDAWRAWDRVLALDPEAPDAHAYRSQVLLDLHEWAAAVGDLEVARRRDPESTAIAMNLALALWKLGRPDDARRELLAILERNPRHVPAINRLAEIEWERYVGAAAAGGLQRGRTATHLDEAVRWWQRSLEIDPQQPDVRARIDEALAIGTE